MRIFIPLVVLAVYGLAMLLLAFPSLGELPNSLLSVVKAYPWLTLLTVVILLFLVDSIPATSRALAVIWQLLRKPAMAVWHWFTARRFGYLLGFDLDPDAKRQGAARLSFNDQEGYSVFNALATFAIAQAAAVTAVAKSEEHKLLVLGIYGLTVGVTLGWIVAMLRAKRKKSGDGKTYLVRAYDKPSIRYGRWTFTWTLIVAGILMYLGKENLLPNQTPRVDFEALDIRPEPMNYKDWYTATPRDARRLADRWLEKLSGRVDMFGAKEDFFILKQTGTFPESYKRFSLVMTCNPKFIMGDRFAFLVKEEETGTHTTYRQMAFQTPGDNKAKRDVLDIEDANKGEYLLVLVYVKHKEDKPETGADTRELPRKDTIDVKLTNPLPQRLSSQ